MKWKCDPSRMTLRVGVNGIAGRMGQSIVQVLREDSNAVLGAGWEHEQSPHVGKNVAELIGDKHLSTTISSNLAETLHLVDVVIDFSSPKATPQVARACAERKKSMVIGTTGLEANELAAISELAKEASVVVAPNMSPGVTVLFALAEQAARLLGPDFDAEIVEMHHRNKVDAPSGTGLRLAQIVAQAKQTSRFVYGREGQVGKRSSEELGVLSLRGGDVIGDHTLIFAGPGERIELTHRASGRDIFARGALRAAHWVVRQPPGIYDMADVMGIK